MAGKLITQVLAELRGGVFANHASDELSKLVERIQESGKKGSITITLEVTPHGKNNREMHVLPKLGIKAPPAPDTTEAGIFYAVRGDLVRDDPDQAKLPFGANRVTRVAGDQQVDEAATG
ncbi:MAG: hypothetical protein V4641_05510 [Pseudomonadota bacterium]